MNLYGADHHLMVLTDMIDADVHKHSFIQVTVSLRSAFGIELGEERVNCKGIVIDSNVNHRLDGRGQPLLLLLMDSTSNLAASFKKQLSGRAYCEFPYKTIERAASYVLDNYGDIGDSASYNLFLSELLQLLGVDNVKSTAADERVNEFIRLLKDCKGSEHSVDSLAKQVCLSGSRLSHLFKANTGISLSGYLVLHKLQKAIYLIFNGMSITEAALSAGFDSPSHFAAASKQLLGMAAKDIRKDSVFLKVSSL
ncbi:Arabinose operon regulatory protein [compost metagenome]